MPSKPSVVVAKPRRGAEPRTRRRAASAGTPIVLGTLVAGETDDLWVDFPGNRQGPLQARSTVPLARVQLRRMIAEGRQVVLLLADEGAPVVLGLLHPLTDLEPGELKIEGDDRRASLSAADELVLRCGDASLTLRRNGRVSLRGTTVESRAKGMNRIRGGTVALN
jgi:hypothetical protein